MKSLNSVTVLALAAALFVGATGCKHGPKPLTVIPRNGTGPIASDDLVSPLAKLGQGANGRNTPPGNQLGDPNGPNGKNLGNETASKPLFDPNNPANQNPGNRPPEGTPEDGEVLKAETVHFDYDRSSVKASELPKVQRVAVYLKSQPSNMLRIEGNCDERGTEEYNRSLGERRALAVRELLIAAGVAPERITTVTYGEDKPFDPGHDEAAWSQNRRADFIVLKTGSVTTGTQ